MYQSVCAVNEVCAQEASALCDGLCLLPGRPEGAAADHAEDGEVGGLQAAVSPLAMEPAPAVRGSGGHAPSCVSAGSH